MFEVINRETGEVTTFANEGELQKARDEVLNKWYAARQAAAEAKSIIEAEQALRKEVAMLFFLTPKEGVNNYELTAGYKLKLTYKIDRKVEEAAIDMVRKQLEEIGVSIDPLIEYKPSLSTKEYKSLVQVNANAAKVFEQCLVIKPASPTLEIVEPKK